MNVEDGRERRETRDQLRALFQDINNGDNPSNSDETILLQLLSQLVPESLQEEWFESMNSNKKDVGCSETFISSLPRIDIKELKDKDSSCSICYCSYRDDKFPLVAQLPHCHHHFDFECISIWLSKNKTCPMCRDDVMSHKEEIDTTAVELEEDWGMYG